MLMKSTDLRIADERAQPSSIEEAIENLPDDMRETAKELHGQLGLLKQDTLDRLYEVGQIVKRGYDTVAAARRSVGKPVRGLGLVDQWAQGLGINSRSLRICLKIVNLYAPEEFRIRISRSPIGWTHLVHLVTIEDPQEREQLEDDIVVNQWSAKELASEIRGRHGNRRRGSGRQPAVPRSLEEGLDQLLAELRKLRDRCQQVWFGDRYDIVSAISDVPPEELNADLGNKIQQAVKLLEELPELASREAERLREGLEWVEEALAESPHCRAGAGADLRVPAAVGVEGGGD